MPYSIVSPNYVGLFGHDSLEAPKGTLLICWVTRTAGSAILDSLGRRSRGSIMSILVWSYIFTTMFSDGVFLFYDDLYYIYIDLWFYDVVWCLISSLWLSAVGFPTASAAGRTRGPVSKLCGAPVTAGDFLDLSRTMIHFWNCFVDGTLTHYLKTLDL